MIEFSSILILWSINISAITYAEIAMRLEWSREKLHLRTFLGRTCWKKSAYDSLYFPFCEAKVCILF